MLAIRMQRTGRKGSAQFRMVVQDSRRTPSSGNIVAALGSYDPHTKQVKIDTEKATTYLNNGAQPSGRAAAILQKEGVALPAWVKARATKERTLKNSDKLRKNRPAEEAVAEQPVEVAEPAAEEVAEEVAAPEAEALADETPSEEPKAEETATEA